MYFARLRVGGKLIRRSLKTRASSVAKLKLADLEKEERARIEGRARVLHGKVTFGDLLAEYRERLAADHTIKPRTREYRAERIAAGLKRARIKAKELSLPTENQFLELVAEIRRVPFGPGRGARAEPAPRPEPAGLLE